MKLYAVRIFVRDWEKACEFYRDTLGLPERLKSTDLDWAEDDLGGPCFGVELIDPTEEVKASLDECLAHPYRSRISNPHTKRSAAEALNSLRPRRSNPGEARLLT